MKKKLLILAFFATYLVQGQNLIQNGSFETFTSTTPDSWTIINGSSNQESTTVNEGLSSLKVFPESPLPFFSPYFWISQDFTLSNTEEYTLKFDYFVPGSTLTNNISGIGYELSLNNSDDAFFFPPSTSIPVVFGSWQTATLDFKILAFRSPATSASIKLTLQARSDSGFTGTSAYFDNVIVAKKNNLGTSDFTKNTNPVIFVSSNEIQLNNDYKDSSYAIYSIDGKAVKTNKSISSESINISELSKGIYLLKLNNAASSIKFIKQ